METIVFISMYFKMAQSRVNENLPVCFCPYEIFLFLHYAS